MVTLETLSYLSEKPEQFIDITGDVHAAIERSGVTNGLAAIILSHTHLRNRGKRRPSLRRDGPRWGP